MISMIDYVLNTKLLTTKHKLPCFLPLLLKNLIVHTQLWCSIGCFEIRICHKSKTVADLVVSSEGHHPMQFQLL